MNLVRTALAAALALAAAPAFAQTYSQTVFFGDSLTDAGHFRPTLVQIAGPQAAVLGKFTTNPGLVWSEYLADFYDTAALSANQGGTNYAVGGARVGTNSSATLAPGVTVPVPSLATQVNSYLASTGGRAAENHRGDRPRSQDPASTGATATTWAVTAAIATAVSGSISTAGTTTRAACAVTASCG